MVLFPVNLLHGFGALGLSHGGLGVSVMQSFSSGRVRLTTTDPEIDPSNPRYSPCSPFLILTNLVGGA